MNVRGHDLIKKLGWQTLEERRDYYVATLMHKCINQNAPIHLINNIILTEETHFINTRASTNGVVQIPEANCELFKTSFNYQGAALWNSLPSELRSITDIHEFKFFYKELFFKNERGAS